MKTIHASQRAFSPPHPSTSNAKLDCDSPKKPGAVPIFPSYECDLYVIDLNRITRQRHVNFDTLLKEKYTNF